MMMIMIVFITDLIIFARYSQLDIILLFTVEVPDNICSLAALSVDGDVCAVLPPCDGDLVSHTIPHGTGQLVPALLQLGGHFGNISADNYFNFN